MGVGQIDSSDSMELKADTFESRSLGYYRDLAVVFMPNTNSPASDSLGYIHSVQHVRQDIGPALHLCRV